MSCACIVDVAPWKSTINIARRSRCGGMCTSNARFVPPRRSVCFAVPAWYAAAGAHAPAVDVGGGDVVRAPTLALDGAPVVVVGDGGITVRLLELHAANARAPHSAATATARDLTAC